MVKQQFHFIAGLPRSGSTLLSAILRQNPRFHAGMTSPVSDLMNSMILKLGAGSEFGAVVSTEQRRRLVGGVFHSYYADQDDKEVIFDTSRLWTSRMSLLMDQFPDSKVIACVRNLAWIMDSIERKFRQNPYEVTRLFKGSDERSSVYSRVDALAKSNRMVGLPWIGLKEAFYGEYSKSLLIVDYDLLARIPEKVIPLIYQFIDQPQFQHDYQNVEYDAPEFDAAHGMHGMHKVRKQVSFEPRPSILPPDVFAKFNKMSFWQNIEGSQSTVIVPSRKENA